MNLKESLKMRLWKTKLFFISLTLFSAGYLQSENYYFDPCDNEASYECSSDYETFVNDDNFVEACDCVTQEIPIPRPSCSYSLEFKALYLQPSCSNNPYAAEIIPIPTFSPDWKIREVDPGYDFGFELGFGILCYKTCQATHINFAHFYSNDEDSKRAKPGEVIGPIFDVGPDAFIYTRAEGRAFFHYDALSVNRGFYFNACDCFLTHLFLGLDTVYIKQNLNTYFSNLDETVTRQFKQQNSFVGIGPQIGVDFTTKFFYGFRLVGGGALSLLAGNARNHVNFYSVTPALPPLEIDPPNKQSLSIHDRTNVVAALKTNLGFATLFRFCNYMIDLEAGYDVRVYINAIQSMEVTSESVTAPPISDTVAVNARAFHRSTSNFALAGPYLRFNVGFCF